MSYFPRSFPKIGYDLKGDGQTIRAEDLLTRIKVKKSISSSHALFSTYNVKDWQSPESIAYESYGNANYHWILLLFNQMFDRYYEWPMSEYDLIQYADDKYDDINEIHHYEIPQRSGDPKVKVWVESDVPFAESITNIEYERTLNESRKSIRIIDPRFVTIFVEEYRSLL